MNKLICCALLPTSSLYFTPFADFDIKEHIGAPYAAIQIVS